MRNKKVLLSAALVVSAVSSALAQGNGLAGINDATNMVTSYFDPGTKLIYAIGAVVGLIGGIKVYNKFSSGDPDTSKTAASWFGACIGFGAGAASMLVFYTFRMNARYGEHGLMKLAAARRRPRYLINRKGACRFLNRRKEVRHA